MLIRKFRQVTFFLDLICQSDSDESQTEDKVFDEQYSITHYYRKGFEYDEILHFLRERHNHDISRSTLLRRLKLYGLSRRPGEDILDDSLTEARDRIQTIIDGPGSSGGYRAVWHTLRMEGTQVPRKKVQNLLKEIDPKGCESRQRHRLKRRVYSNPGPDFAWHIDGYDKLKPFGLPIHGAIDGFSRKVLWLKVLRSNNSPDNIATEYLKCVHEFGGCPMKLITDLGTENSLAASMQIYFWDDIDAHRYVPSPRNQRIESWWSYFCKCRGRWWRNFFQDLESEGVLDMTCELQSECLWYCFSETLQKDLDFVKEHWNTHRIRKSRFDTIPGRPDALYYLPERNSGQKQMKLEVPDSDINHALEHIVQQDYINGYQEYFEYARTQMDINKPYNWAEALSLYKILVEVAATGSIM